MRLLHRTMPLLVATLLALPVSARDAFRRWDGSPGSLKVKRIASVTLHDAARSKDVVASILIPEGRGPFPLVVFSHGYSGSKDGYQQLTSYWASHGYVVIQPTHADAGAIRSIRDVLELKGIWKRERPPQWRNRIADLELMIDSIGELERRIPELRGRIDHSRIGVAGHSYGALTTELIVGTRSYATSPPLEFHDPRIKAAIAMSPEGTNEDLGFRKDSWRGIDIPTMFMTGSLDRPAEGEPPVWRTEPFEYSPPGGKYLVFIEGARHLTFSGRILQQSGESRGRRATRRRGGLLSRRQDTAKEAEMFSWVQSASLAFWDASLVGSAAARAFLASGALAKRSGGAVAIESK